jgi:hypothetical protein
MNPCPYCPSGCLFCPPSTKGCNDYHFLPNPAYPNKSKRSPNFRPNFCSRIDQPTLLTHCCTPSPLPPFQPFPPPVQIKVAQSKATRATRYFF